MILYVAEVYSRNGMKLSDGSIALGGAYIIENIVADNISEAISITVFIYNFYNKDKPVDKVIIERRL